MKLKTGEVAIINNYYKSGKKAAKKRVALNLIKLR